MIRSMMSGISGLKNHQIAMDVIGNNIANVNTTGFKASRVTFSEVFSNTMANATAPNDETGIGGTNPMQVGMGSGLASIDMLYTSGNIERTDNPLDVSIDGSGLFIVKESDASGFSFTRAGAFGVDKQGNLVTSNGSLVCGWTKKTQSEGAIELDGFDSSMEAEPINVYVDDYNGDKRIIAPQPTTDVEFSGNLNVNSATGTVVNIPMTLYDNYGYEVQANMRLVKNENLSKSNTLIKEDHPGDGMVLGLQTGIYVKPLYNTNISYKAVTDGTGDYYCVPDMYKNSTTQTGGTYSAGDLVNGKYVVPAGTTDVIRNSDVTGTVPPTTYVIPDDDWDAYGIVDMSSCSAIEGNYYQAKDVVNGKYIIPAGLKAISHTDSAGTKGTAHPEGSYLKMNTEDELAGYTEVASTVAGALKVLDRKDELSINTWSYTLTVNNEPVKNADGEIIEGKVKFGNGDNQAEDYGNVTEVTIGKNKIPDFKLAANVNYDNKPDNVAEVRFDFSALTQYAAKDSAAVYNSNGYPTGKLSEYSIGNDGVITGIYSNGKQQAIGMIALAYFDNPSGLKSIGDSTYAQTANSGEFRTTVPGAEGGSLTSNTLEMSNVDLSTEFTNMIVYQRGFQANSRTITTADEMLQELVNLKR